jgi:hypothetical protein
MFTYRDAIEHVLDYIGAGAADELAIRDARKAVLAAYREFPTEKTWAYLWTQGRVDLSAPYATGTIAFDLTGGASERLWTLSSGTWPTWAADGYIRVGEVVYRVLERLSDTTITTASDLSPTEDIAAGTAYTLYRDTYLLPDDFTVMDEALYQRMFGVLIYRHPRSWLRANRVIDQSGDPQWFTVTGDDERFPQRMAIKVWPYPDQARSLDFMYRRSPRRLRCELDVSGTVSVSTGVTSITGSGTSFSSYHEGSCIRVSSSLSLAPTSQVGENPANFEGVISDVASASAITVRGVPPFEASPDFSASGAKYTLSDPIDIIDGVMLTAFHRRLEWEISKLRSIKDKPSARAAYGEALKKAKEADSPSLMGRVAGPGGSLRQRLASMPYDASSGGSWVADGDLP